MAEREKILEVRDLNISFKTDSGTVNAIRGVNLDLYRGETIAIVGESGSGKSVTTKAIMGIMAGNGSIDGGSINYTWTDENTGERITKDICQLSEKEMQSEIRGRKIAMVSRSNDIIKPYNDNWKSNHGTNDSSLQYTKRRSL